MMALVLPPVQVAAIMLPILCLMDLVGIWAYWKKWEDSVLLRLALAAAVGVAAVALTFHIMAPWTIPLLNGVIALGFTANYAVRRFPTTGMHQRKPRPRSGWIRGAVAGFPSLTGPHARSP